MVLVGRRARQKPAGALVRARRIDLPPPKRWTVQMLLVECGMAPDSIYMNSITGARGLFSRGWEDRLDLDALTIVARQAYRRRAKQIRLDLPGNGAKRRLTGAHERLRMWFWRRGVRL